MKGSTVHTEQVKTPSVDNPTPWSRSQSLVWKSCFVLSPKVPEDPLPGSLVVIATE